MTHHRTQYVIRYTGPNPTGGNGQVQYVASYGLVDCVKWARRFDRPAAAEQALKETAEADAVGTGIGLTKALSWYEVVTVQLAVITPEEVIS